MNAYDAAETAYKNGYIAGVKDAFKWIPVSERLPKNDYEKHWKERQYYLVHLQYGQLRVARYGYKKYDWWVDSHDCVLSDEHYTGVTHWLPLPKEG